MKRSVFHRSGASVDDVISFVGSCAGAVCITDRRGHVHLSSAGMERLLGWESRVLQGKNMHDLLHACPGTEACDLRDVAASGGRPHAADALLFGSGETTLLHCDGHRVWVTYMTAPVLADGRIEGTALTFRPLEEREQELLALRAEGEQIRSMAEAAMDALWVGDADGVVTMANAAPSIESAVAYVLAGSLPGGDAIPRVLEALCSAGEWDMATYWALDSEEQVVRWHAGWPESGIVAPRFETLGRGLTFACGVDLPGRAWESREPVWIADIVTDANVVRSLAASREGLHGALAFCVNVGGELHGVIELLSKSTRSPEPGATEGYRVAAEHLGLHIERARTEESLRHQAMHDELTGLPNRVLLRERLGRALGAAAELGRSVSLLLIDLDGFKAVNGTHGHHVGDTLLQRIAERLDETVRRSDTVARLGGDEFAVLLPSTRAEEARCVAEKLLAQVVDPVVVDGIRVRVTGSIGIAVFPDHASEPSLLMQCADIAMYDAKRTSAGIAVHGVPSRERDHEPSLWRDRDGRLR